MKRFLLITVALLMLLTAGCAAVPEPTEPTVPETLAPTEPPLVDIGGSEVDVAVTELDLTVLTYDLEQLVTAAEKLEAVSTMNLGATQLTADQVAQLRAAFPNARIDYTLELYDQEVTAETEFLDLSMMKLEEAEQILAQLPLATDLQQINFLSEEGACVFAIEDIPVLDQFREALPEVNFRVSFELFSQTVTSEDTRIEYYLVPIGNEGVETVRAVLPYLSACEYLLMDGCEVDNEIMAQLREDFSEQMKIVWRVWIIEPRYDSEKYKRWAGFLTDTHRIRTILINDDNCDVLKYCTEVKYVDFGHNDYISDFSFLGYMPKLEVAIIGLTECDDISMLVNCPELEYLEIYGSNVTDISPLAACTKLKHLNISRLKIDDITPIYGLELERLRCVVTDVPREQLDEYARLHPDCQMLLAGYAPHKNGWRYEIDHETQKVPRYALLQEQLEYAIDHSYGIP